MKQQNSLLKFVNVKLLYVMQIDFIILEKIANVPLMIIFEKKILTE